MTELEYNYEADLENRRELDSGGVKYDLTIICEETGDKLIDTTYAVSKRQEEEKLEKMIKHFTEKKAEEYENNAGKDHSGTSIKV